MRRILHILLFSLPIFAYGQIGFENFESYILGAFIPQCDTNEWSIFGATDQGIVISDTIAYSGNHSLVVQKTHGGLGLKGELPILNQNIAELSFMAKLDSFSNVFTVESNSGNNSSQGETVVHMTIQGHINSSISVGGLGNISFAPNQNQWMEYRFKFDFNLGIGYFYYDDNLIVSWDVTLNSNGMPISNMQIDGFTIGSFNPFPVYYDDFYAVNYVVSTEEQQVSSFHQLKVFPNPATDRLSIQLDLQQPQEVNYQLTDAIGQVIKSWSAREAGHVMTEVDVSDLGSGLYFLTVQIGEEVKTEKVVIVR